MSITRADQTVSRFVSRKVEALLVYLAYERREHQREWLAALLWDDLTQERALGNLRTALSNLTSQLGDVLQVSRQSVMLRPDLDCRVDAQTLLEAIDASDGPVNAPAARDLTAALALYKGDLLAGFHLRGGENFEHWRTVESERLKGRVLGALQRLSRYTIERGDYEAGIAHARKALSLDPLNEESHRHLILMLARSGQRSAAMAQYDLCLQVLRDELDVEPEPETVELMEAILANEVMATAPARPAVHLPTMPTPFINRPGELRRIAESLRQPTCRLLTILGGGGMGKTRLALQSAAELAEDFRDGAVFVPLVSVLKGEFLPVEIANALGFTPQGVQDPLAELADYLSDREMLLVLDNFEHRPTTQTGSRSCCGAPRRRVCWSPRGSG
ncbi:MAG: hypothetical protein IPK19_05305 [Chloroflexi bacterium]|nr:hypothetical protein [Chloroflexota bacterium]